MPAYLNIDQPAYNKALEHFEVSNKSADQLAKFIEDVVKKGDSTKYRVHKTAYIMSFLTFFSNNKDKFYYDVLAIPNHIKKLNTLLSEKKKTESPKSEPSSSTSKGYNPLYVVKTTYKSSSSSRSSRPSITDTWTIPKYKTTKSSSDTPHTKYLQKLGEDFKKTITNIEIFNQKYDLDTSLELPSLEIVDTEQQSDCKSNRDIMQFIMSILGNKILVAETLDEKKKYFFPEYSENLLFASLSGSMDIENYEKLRKADAFYRIRKDIMNDYIEDMSGDSDRRKDWFSYFLVAGVSPKEDKLSKFGGTMTYIEDHHFPLKKWEIPIEEVLDFVCVTTKKELARYVLFKLPYEFRFTPLSIMIREDLNNKYKEKVVEKIGVIIQSLKKGFDHHNHIEYNKDYKVSYDKVLNNSHDNIIFDSIDESVDDNIRRKDIRKTKALLEGIDANHIYDIMININKEDFFAKLTSKAKEQWYTMKRKLQKHIHPSRFTRRSSRRSGRSKSINSV